MADVIGERLINLRKHLGERLGTKLTTQDVGEKVWSGEAQSVPAGNRTVRHHA